MSRGDERHVAELLGELTDEDFRLDEVPDGLWTRVEAAAADATVPTLPARPRRRWAPLAAAAAVLLVLVVGLAAVVVRSAVPTEVELGSARLTSEGLARRSDLLGEAHLIEVDGRQEIDLDLPGLAPESGAAYELWLLAPDATRLRSLGTTDGRGRYVLPDGIDPRSYPVVDVSREPADGNPAHSGDSLVRGLLDLS